MPDIRLATRKEIAKAIFRVRSFKGRTPDQIRRRFQLATALIRDVTKGRITLSTAKKLAREGYEAILESPFLVVGSHKGYVGEYLGQGRFRR